MVDRGEGRSKAAEPPRSGLGWKEIERINRAELRAELKRPGSEKLEETLELSQFAGEFAAVGARSRDRP